MYLLLNYHFSNCNILQHPNYNSSSVLPVIPKKKNPIIYFSKPKLTQKPSVPESRPIFLPPADSSVIATTLRVLFTRQRPDAGETSSNRPMGRVNETQT